MDPNIRNFSEIEKLIKENPKLAQEQAFEWQRFLKSNAIDAPELYSIENADEFHLWIQAHPERHIDPSIFVGKEISESYYYLREQNENAQMQNEGKVDTNNVPQELVALPLLAASFLERPKIIQEDRDYQKIEEKLKKEWLLKNPGKDFSSKEGLDYFYGSLEEKNAPSLSSDAEKTFRDNPKLEKRIERYDKEQKKIYKNPQNDPALRENERKTQEHIQARQTYLNTNPNAPKSSFEETSRLVREKSSGDFTTKYPEKATNYAQKINDRKEEKRSDTQSQSLQRMLNKIRQEEMGPKIPRQTLRSPERFLRRAFGRGTSQAGKGMARAGGRLASRVASRAAMAAGRAAMQGIAALVANPVGLIVIGVIILIVIIVFLIVMFAGRGLDGQPTTECFDSSGTKTIFVADGNACAEIMAEFYTREEGAPVTARCLDKCTDLISISCNRNSSNRCSSPDMCVTQEAFCFEYTPQDSSKRRQHDCLTGGGGYYSKLGPNAVNSCSNTLLGTPTPSTTPSPIPDPRCVPACASGFACTEFNEGGGIFSYSCVPI